MLALCFRKQKTAYELRISDWSSDVGSSGLPRWADQISGPPSSTAHFARVGRIRRAMSGHHPGQAMSENHAHRRLADRVEPEQPGRGEAKPPNRLGAHAEEARRAETTQSRRDEQSRAGMATTR